jgi:opacity protein-like surface antigen
MRSFAILIIGTLATCGAARAQSAPGTQSAAGRGYVEGVAQSAFGSSTSQSYGAEAGFTIRPNLQIYVEGGQTRDASTASFLAAAQEIASFLTQDQSGVTFRARKPITFGTAGLRFLIPVSNNHVLPYLLIGGGVARVKQDVTYAVNGTDVTATLPQLGVVLGTDLSGTETTGIVTAGGGVAWLPWRQLVVDFQYRYGRVFASDQGLNLNRAGVGIGVRF